MAEAKVLWFVVLDADDERVMETTDLGVALAERRRVGGRIVQENRSSGERTVQRWTAAA